MKRVPSSQIQQLKEGSSSEESNAGCKESQNENGMNSNGVIHLKVLGKYGKVITKQARLSQRFRLPILSQIEKSKEASDKLQNQKFRGKLAEIWGKLSQDANELPTQSSKQFKNYSSNLSDLYQRMESNFHSQV